MAGLELKVHPTGDVLETIRHHPTVIPGTTIYLRRCPCLESFDDHVEHVRSPLLDRTRRLQIDSSRGFFYRLNDLTMKRRERHPTAPTHTCVTNVAERACRGPGRRRDGATDRSRPCRAYCNDSLASRRWPSRACSPLGSACER